MSKSRGGFNCREWPIDRTGRPWGSAVLNTTILLFLLQDGITNGAIYALLGLALVLVFAVTRVILIPQGEFVTYGALTYASLASGQMPGTAKLALAMGIVAFAFDLFVARKALHGRLIARAVRAVRRVHRWLAALHWPEHHGLRHHHRLHRRALAVLRPDAVRQGAARHRRQPARRAACRHPYHAVGSDRLPARLGHRRAV